MKIIKVVIIIILFITSVAVGQSLNGMTGLFNIPTADLAGDGRVFLGANYLERNHLKYAEGVRDVIAPFITIVFLPFVEVSIRINRQLNYFGESHVMDRMLSGRIRFLEETKYFPSITLGLQNPYSTLHSAKNFTSTYVVLSKNYNFNSLFDRVHFTIGYGSDIIDAANHQYIGMFGGLSFTFLNSIELMGEYDAERFNAGLRIKLFKHIKLLGGFMDLKHFSGGAAVSWEL